MKHINSILVLLLVTLLVSTVAAMDAPAMWTVQNEEGIALMVNTSEDSSGANAWVYFDPACINITNITMTGPYTPLDGPGWSNHLNHNVIALTNFSVVEPGEYKIAQMEVECVGSNCTSAIGITKAEPVGVVVYNGTFACDAAEISNNTTVSIGICRGISSLPLVIENVTNLGSCDITISWNPEVVSVSNIAGRNMDSMLANTEHIDEGWIRIGAIQTENLGLSGRVVVARIFFEPVAYGESTIVISGTVLKDATPDCNTIEHTVQHGAYYSPIDGDANGDGEVGPADVFYILRHCIGFTGYDTINDNSDVNGDGIVDVSDAMYLAKHLLLVPGFETLR